MTRHQLLLRAVLVLLLVLLGLSMPPGARERALAAALPVVAGLIVLETMFRDRVSEGTAFWTTVLAILGTGLFPLLAHAPDGRRAIAFLLGAIGVWVLGRGGSPLRLAALGVLVAAGALMAPLEPGTPGVARALFGSRGGLFYETPLLWVALGGLALMMKRERRANAPLAAVGLLPFVVAPFKVGPLDVALPALLVGLGVALEALCGLAARRPSVVVVVVVALLAVSNLAFMEQYRHTLRRDDTVSFPQVSEGNARLVSRAFGSPVAWPANWIWSARHGLPVERWDLLSGQRLDPGPGVVVDVGDPEQDAVFLLDGWSVRHECGHAICREVEERAELVLPLEQAAIGLNLRAMGPGTLRIAANGSASVLVSLGSELQSVDLEVPFRRGPNRIVFEADAGTHVLVDRLLVQGER